MTEPPSEAHGRLPRKAEALAARRRIRMGMPWIDPKYSLGLLGRFDVKVDNDTYICLLTIFGASCVPENQVSNHDKSGPEFFLPRRGAA